MGELLPSWELYPFVTSRRDDLETVEADRRMPLSSLTIRDLKNQELAHLPSGRSSPTPAGR
jgi:hypothetical protein